MHMGGETAKGNGQFVILYMQMAHFVKERGEPVNKNFRSVYLHRSNQLGP